MTDNNTQASPLADAEQLRQAANTIHGSWHEALSGVQANPEVANAMQHVLQHLELLTQSTIAMVNELRKMAEERDKPRIHLVQ